MALCALLALSSCANSPRSSSAGATVPGSTTTTDPYAVPATIDAPYLNRVFLALEKIDGEASRLIVATRRIPPEAATLLHSIFTDEEFKVQAEGWNADIDKGLGNFRTPPGDRVTTVRRIIVVQPTCVAVEVERDYSAVTVDPQPGATALVALAMRPPLGANRTPWVISSQLKSGHLPCA
jgi:hypothetical protein